MKKQMTIAQMVLLLLFSLSAVGLSENKGTLQPILVTTELLRVSDSEMARLQDKRAVTKVKGESLFYTSLLTADGSPSVIGLTRKWPISYHDPRADRFQVQFVDVGSKVDVTTRISANGKLQLEIRWESSKTVDVRAPGDPESGNVYPITFPLVQECAYQDVSFGETLLLSKFNGVAARKYLDHNGVVGGSDNLVFTVRLERP